MIKLNRDKLAKEDRYGNVEFSIEFLFDFALLEEYVIPLGISVVRNLDDSLSYKLFCLSPYFDKTENMVSSGDAPTYEVIITSHVYGIGFHKIEFKKRG